MTEKQINEYLSNEIFRINCHEAGHYIISRHLGFEVIKISIACEIGAGGTFVNHCHTFFDIRLSQLNNIDDIKIYLKNQMICCFAGALAESLLFTDNYKSNIEMALQQYKQGGHSDEQSFKMLNLQYINIEHNCKKLDYVEAYKLIEGNGRRIEEEAKELVDSQAKMIIYIAKETTSRFKNPSIEISHDELEGLCNKFDNC